MADNQPKKNADDLITAKEITPGYLQDHIIRVWPVDRLVRLKSMIEMELFTRK